MTKKKNAKHSGTKLSADNSSEQATDLSSEISSNEPSENTRKRIKKKLLERVRQAENNKHIVEKKKK